MTYNKGGRGKKAPYNSITYRLPEHIKPIVDVFKNAYINIVNSYGIEQANYWANQLSMLWTNHYQKIFDEKDEMNPNSFINDEGNKPITSLSKDEAMDLAKKILRSKKGNKQAQFERLLKGIYGDEIDLEN